LKIEVYDFPFFGHVTKAEVVLEMLYLVDNAVPGVSVGLSAMKPVDRESNTDPALFTMICILPFPNSADFFTRVLMYSASSISPGTATAFPPDLLMSSATCFALAALQSD
jgi:hypothetical protein